MNIRTPRPWLVIGLILWGLAPWGLAPWGPAAQAATRAIPSQSAVAAALFAAGKFAAAGEIDARLVAADPKNAAATLRLGRVALLANRLPEAEAWLRKAIALAPGDADAKVTLAEALYRQDDFQAAAAALAGVDLGASTLAKEQYPTLNRAKLLSFKGQTPYAMESGGDVTRVQFIRSDPLPVVAIRVNGGPEVTVFIDTGGSELALDSDFAKELGLPDFGSVQGTFSGGQHAEVHLSRIESLGLGDFTVKNVPVATLPLRQLSAGLGVKQIDGVIGTTVLYHFLSTLDFPGGELVLRRKAAQAPPPPAGAVAVPFWIASDHFMVGWGRVETIPPTLLFVDTGLAGAGVKLAQPVIEQAGIRLERDKAEKGAGAGGNLEIVPYTMRNLSFGDLHEENVPGLYDGPFPWATLFGFPLAGMVGHAFFKPYAVTFDFDRMTIFIH